MPALTSVFIIDPPENLDPPTDTTLALMRESLGRGHRVLYGTPADLYLAGDDPRASLRPVEFPAGRELFRAGEATETALASSDLLYMRKDPPVDTAYLHATLILDRLPGRVLQINPAATLRRHCEKLLPLHFPGLLPESLVACDVARLEDFLHRLGRIVVKPLEDCSGRGIITLEAGEPDRRRRLEEAVAGGRFVQAQRFLPEISEGDKRVLLLDGEILGAVRRLPPAGSFLSNVNAGGRCVACELTEADRAICARVGPWLAERGIVLAGVDIVGAHVLEINITSPSCLREMNEFYGERLERRVVAHLERRCGARALDRR